MSTWTPAFAADRVTAEAPRLFTQGRTRVAVFRLESGDLYAVDDRCPHEGYPLSQGVRKGCVLTCSWHNYKFDLRDGACVQGDEAVRTFPVRVVDGVVELDLTPPDPAKALPALWTSLEAGLEAGRLGQALRDVARLLDAGVPAAEVAGALAAWNARTAEWGCTHVLPVCADALRLSRRYPGPAFVLALAPAVDLAVHDGVRRPRRALTPAVDPGPDPVVAGAAFLEAVEAEDRDTAEGLLHGGLARGWGRAELEPWLMRACAAHFLDFGHQLIYLVRGWDLLEQAGPRFLPEVLGGYVRGLVVGTREDLLPSWAAFRRRLEGLDLAALYARVGASPGWKDDGAVERAVAFGRPSEAVDAVLGALHAGAPLEPLVDALSLAAAERLLRFDVAIDWDQGVQDGWLSVTHTQTFANAVRHAARRLHHPDVVRLLLQSARLTNHHKVLDLADPPAWQPVPGASVERALAAVEARDTRAALGLTAGLEEGLVPALVDGLLDHALSDRFAAPIVAAHALKNTVVAAEEGAATGERRPLLGAVRLLASPVQERWTARAAGEALAFVTEGKVPKVLAP